VEGVLGRHEKYEWWPMTREFICTCETSLGTSYPDPAHRAHVAAALRAELAEWLGSEGAVADAARAINRADDVALEASNFGALCATYDEQARAALAALAECVGVEEVGA
jgi:hypothetical protein